MAPCLAPVLDEGFESAAFDTLCEVGDGCAHDLIAAADCEGLVTQSNTVLLASNYDQADA
jgi:hypothetical protein